MKHIQTVTRANVQPAQLDALEILTLVGTVLSAVASIVVAVTSITGDK